MNHRPRVPIAGIGIALGLLVAASVHASPAPHEAKFVGDSGEQGAAVSQRLSDSADFRRWGGGTGSGASQKDKAPKVFLTETNKGKIGTGNHIGDKNQPTVADVRKQLTTFVNNLCAQGDPASQAECARIRARLALIPSGQDGSNPAYANDLHPIQYLEWLRLQNDKNQNLLPPPNKITIVDQDALKKILDTKGASALPDPVYRTTTVTVITHHLTPTYKQVLTQFPVWNWQTITIQDGYVDNVTTSTQTTTELVSAGYPTQDVTIERTVVDAGNPAYYTSVIPDQYNSGGGAHPTWPLTTTSPSGARPTVPAQNTTTNLDMATVHGSAGAGTYVVQAGVSYQQYLNAIHDLQIIASGGTALMDLGLPPGVTSGSAVDQTNVLTTTTVAQQGAANAVMPMAGIEKDLQLRMPGVNSSNLVNTGLLNNDGSGTKVPVDTSTWQSNATDLLARTNPTRQETLLNALGGTDQANTQKLSDTSSIQKMSTNPDAPDQMNKFSNLPDPANPSAPRKMDTAAVSNTTTLFISGGQSTTASRTLSAPIK